MDDGYGFSLQGSTHLNGLAREIWFWCKERDIWLSCFHIPGRLNVTADKLSRTRNLDMEWSLEESVFNHIQDIYGQFDTDLFASAKNYKCVKYMHRLSLIVELLLFVHFQ